MKTRWPFGLLLLFLLTVPAAANSPMPAPHLDVQVTRAQEAVAFVDILIRLPTDDVHYTPYNEANGRRFGIAADSGIVRYEQDGYVSFTFHFRDAVADIVPDGDITHSAKAAFVHETVWEASQFTLLKETYKGVRVALLDREGRVLQTAPATTIRGSYGATLYYDAKTNGITDQSRQNPYHHRIWLLTLLGGALLRIVFSVGAETLIALPFRMRPLWKVPLVNLFTQGLLTLLMVWLCGMRGLSYLPVFLLLEGLVYAGEWALYRLWMPGCGSLRTLFYVLVANTVTLAAGIYAAGNGLFWA